MKKWVILIFVLVCIGLMYGRFDALKKLINPQQNFSETSLELYKDVVEINGLYFEKSSNKLFTGRTEMTSEEFRWILNFKDGKKHGKYEVVYNDGRKFEIGYYKEGKKDGVWLDYWAISNKILSKTEFKDNVYLKIEKFHPNGNKWVFWTFKDGKEHGNIDIYDEDGELSWTEIWEDGVHLKTIQY